MITRYPANSATTPRAMGIAELRQATTVQNTWYTIMNVTGSGVINSMFAYEGSVNRTDLEIKVTIDGDATTYTAPSTANDARNIFNASISFFGTFHNLIFKSSCVVEMRHTGAGTGVLAGSIDYGLF